MSLDERGRSAPALVGPVLVEAAVELRWMLLPLRARMVLTTERFYLLRPSEAWSVPVAELRLERKGQRFVAWDRHGRRIFRVPRSVVADVVVAADSLGLKVGRSSEPKKPTTF